MFLLLESPHAEAFLPRSHTCDKANGIIPAVALPGPPFRKHGPFPALCGGASLRQDTCECAKAAGMSLEALC